MMKKVGTFLLLLFLSSMLQAAEQSTRGALLFKQCAGCHGADGKNKAFGRSGIVAGQSVEDLMASLTFFKESDFKTHDSATVMAKQVKNLSNEDLLEISKFISTLK